MKHLIHTWLSCHPTQAVQREAMIMDPEPPAGFFSTFSISDPSGIAHDGLGRTQKRNRRVFVCIPCHRRKLRCDKGQPCSRCAQAGTANECVYQRATSRSNQDPATESDDTLGHPEDKSSLRPGLRQPSQKPPSPPSTSSRRSARAARLNGTTHWTTIAREFGEAWPYIMGANQQWESRHRDIQGLKYLFPTLPGNNFPLGSVSSNTDRGQVLGSLPQRPVVDALVQCYFRAFESTHRLLHARQFADELNAFWISSDHASEVWLAQLCMMLALGCQAAPEHLLRSTGRSLEFWTDFFLDAAQFFFGRSSYFTTPTLTTVRTLCMAVTARMMEIVKGTDMTQLVYLMGFLTRLAMVMYLHRTTSLCQEMPPFEAEMRKRAWVTIQLLDLDVAMRTGTSFIHRDYDADPPLNINDDDFFSSEQHGWTMDANRWISSQELTDSTFQIILADLIPLSAEIINLVNSPTLPPAEYDTVMAWDAQLHQKLQEAESLLALGPHGSVDRLEQVTIQTNFLKVLVHRTLLALHHDPVCAPRTKFPDSIVAIIQSSLAILQVQEAWHNPPVPLQGGTPSRVLGGIRMSPKQPAVLTPLPMIDDEPLPFFQNTSAWLIDFCHDDFGAAMFYLILALRRREFDIVAQHQQQLRYPQQQLLTQDLPLLASSSRNTACGLLKTSMSLFRARACRSIPHFDEFVRLSLSSACLRGLIKGEPILTHVLSAAVEIEQTVLATLGGKQDALLLWTEGADQHHPFHTSLGQPGLSIPEFYGFGPA
ncbi:hypothetical protein B0H63DRAFT_47859 [Podospora didyma]|uniref:Zn(2)-C6 fungal-type domain-containing protein n=1 Tax=Podospora didyma TaxID=330526 RepID=A0AAE0P723_9PEZI|nr:hypothetical protein B0H63DRAFT_47859 [Podospora didyma]